MKVVEALFAAQHLRSLTDDEFVGVTSALLTMPGLGEAASLCRGLPDIMAAIRREGVERLRAIVARQSTHRDVLQVRSA